MEEIERAQSRAYGNIVEKLKSGVYQRNAETLKKNRKNLLSTQARLTRKLAAANKSKQERGNIAKVYKLARILEIMNAVPKSNAAPVAVAAPVAATAVAPVPKLPTPPRPVVAAAAAAAAPVPIAPEVLANVSSLQSNFFGTMNRLNKKELEGVMKYLSEIYYNDGVSLISDEEYDRLRDLLLHKFGESDVLTSVGAEVTKSKIKLPYFMGSMDKIKPERNNLESWRLKYPGPVCISDKLDGISALAVKSGVGASSKRALYTRGDGTIGQDITHMLPYIQIGDMPGVESYAVRGELIVSKANYEKVKEGKRGARQMVAGLSNQKTLGADRIELMGFVEFVAYEVIVPEALTPVQQFTLLDEHSTFNTVRWSRATEVSIESLSNTLTARKEDAKYEIDGIIVAHDAVYPRTSTRNPEHAFAFKMMFADQQATTEVLRIVWEASKDGYLKPTVNFEPVNIGGVVIQYATGFNASFIHSNGLGPGAYVDIIRSGDVIPYIKEVKSAAPGGPQMPEAPWHWNTTHVDAILDDAGASTNVQKRVLLYFANTLEIGFCGEGNIAKVYDAGIKTIPEFVHVTAKRLVDSGEFAPKSAAKLVSEIKLAVDKATIVQWAVGSGVFGRGIGTKRLQAAFDLIPASLDTPPDLEARITALTGWSKESARGVVENLPEFKGFMASVGIKAHAPSPKAAPVTEGKLLGQIVLFTGFHPKDMIAAVVREGGVVADAWGAKVTLLVIKDASVSNEKTKRAATAGVPVITGLDLLARIA